MNFRQQLEALVMAGLCGQTRVVDDQTMKTNLLLEKIEKKIYQNNQNGKENTQNNQNGKENNQNEKKIPKITKMEKKMTNLLAKIVNGLFPKCCNSGNVRQ